MLDSHSLNGSTNRHDLPSLVRQCQWHLPSIVRQLCNRLHRYPSPDIIEDYCEGILLLLLADDGRRLKAFDPTKASLKTWLTAVTKNELIEEFRREKTWDSLDNVPPEQLPELPQQERNVIRQEEFEAVMREVAKLSARRQQLFALLWMGYAPVEIAERMQIKPATVHWMTHELIQKLRAGIEKNGGQIVCQSGREEK